MFPDQLETLHGHDGDRLLRGYFCCPSPSLMRVGSSWIIQILLERHNPMRFGRRLPPMRNKSLMPATRMVLAICRPCAMPATRVTKLRYAPPMKSPWMVGHSAFTSPSTTTGACITTDSRHATSRRSSVSSKKQSTCFLRIFRDRRRSPTRMMDHTIMGTVMNILMTAGPD
jgi:hypothetical protein